MSALQQRLLEIFAIEHQEHLEVIRKIISCGEAGDGAPSAADLTEAMRRAHSLKGAARAVGLGEVENLAHRLEALFIEAERSAVQLDRDVCRHVLDSLDEIEDRVAVAYSGVAAAESGSPPQELEAPASVVPADASADMAVVPGELTAAARPSSVRLATSNLDQLLQSAGELRGDMLSQRSGVQDLHAIAREMAELDMLWGGLWKQFAHSSLTGRQTASTTSILPRRHRMIAASGAAIAPKPPRYSSTFPARLSVGGIESAPHGAAEGVLSPSVRSSSIGDRAKLLQGGDEIAARVKTLSRRLAAAIQSQDRCARSLHRNLDDFEARVKAVRMVPADSVFGGFRKMVRDLAASEGKRVEVTVDGLDCEADRLVLQRIKDPVMHMLRNAISHGIERPEQRQAAGKPAQGRISLSVATHRDRLMIVIDDDGRGVDFVRVAEKAVSQGLVTQAQASSLSGDALCQLLFEPGFSTAVSVSKISGRGVGLSVARESVASLQGRIHIEAVPGQGTRIELSLPVSILSRRLLLVSFQGQTYALPADAVQKLLRVNLQDMAQVDGHPAMQFDGAALVLISIGDVLQAGEPAVGTRQEQACVVVLRNGGSSIGVLVDAFVAVNDFVIRALDVGGSERVWSGVISTADGSPCLVLNPDAFAIPKGSGRGQDALFKREPDKKPKAKVVLVVDDSITTRTLEKSILEAHGYRVRLSVDGRDAIAQLRSDPTDIVVSDIEMPHVNGFELVRSMKSDRSLADIPIVLVTSRDDPEDRRRGLELGADAYVVKQRFDQAELLRTIGQII